MMEFYCKFYGSIKFQAILFGLLLSLSVLNGGQSDCNYYQYLEPGQIYYTYNPEYPNFYEGKTNCTWEMRSSYPIKLNCSVEMTSNCYQNKLSVHFEEGNTVNYLEGNGTFILKGRNPIIKLDSQCYSQGGRFLCEIQVLKNTNTNTNCECGWKKVTKIVGGKETGVNEYPMMSGLVDFQKKIIYCGCTIISKQYVITAAHCVDKRNIGNIGVVVGEHDVTTGSETDATRLFRLDYCKMHPEYQTNEIANDIAVCRINGNIIYSDKVGPVCLPFQHKGYLSDGSNVTALGWGLTEFGGSKATKLQEVDLNVISPEECKQFYNGVTYKNLCTFTPGKDTCQMDSGGPLLWQDPATHNLVLAGITSSGSGCASEEPGIAIRTKVFMDWIVSVTPGAQYCKIE